MSQKKRILDEINSSEDLKRLSLEELNRLSKEIREKLIEVTLKNGGHFASNLGVVELTIAMHYVFNTPTDQIIWDVGHQCYTHKILTGRKEKINTIRQKNGLSGFPKREESIHDSFNTGHSSTSISAALGLANAKMISKEPGHVIAVIGDGALSGGLAYEGLNNAGHFKKNFIIILNDNKMSISRNVGSIAKYLSEIRIQPYYLKTKSVIKKSLLNIPIIGHGFKKIISKSKSALKDVIYHGTLFEDMGFAYYGPVDGHDLNSLIRVLQSVKNFKKPVLVHVNTVKGKGYFPAERDPKAFHGVTACRSNNTFSDFFGKVLCDLAEKDKKICAITAAMKVGTGLSEFSKKFKNRFFDVGIAEGHAVTFASGLAAGGMLPVFAVYSSFLQRSYDQIVHDAATQNLHVVLAVDRAGLVGEDGETHQGVFDVAFLNSIPNVTVFSPTYFSELKEALETCLYNTQGVAVVRYPRGTELKKNKSFISGNSFDVYKSPENKICIITYGRLFHYACLAQERLERENVNACVIKLNRIKPLDLNILDIINNFKIIFFFEEGVLHGGIAETFGSLLYKNNYKGKYFIKSIEDKFISHGSVKELLEELGLDENGIYEEVKRRINILED